MTDQAAALRALLDKQEITELLTRYLRSVDRGDVATAESYCITFARIKANGEYYHSFVGARMIDRRRTPAGPPRPPRPPRVPWMGHSICCSMC